MTEKQSELLDEIRKGQRVLCFFAVAQPLVDSLVDIIREQNAVLNKIDVCATEFADKGVPMNAECCGIISKWTAPLVRSETDPAFAREGGAS